MSRGRNLARGEGRHAELRDREERGVGASRVVRAMIRLLWTEGLISLGRVRPYSLGFLHRCHANGTKRREHQESPNPPSLEGPHPQHRNGGARGSWKNDIV